MGIYLNPGKQHFQMAVNSEIYVDKTEMIRYLNTLVNTNQRYVSVSRPRRFGKSMAADMLCAYYGREADSQALFSCRKITQSSLFSPKGVWNEYLGSFDVLRIVATDFFRTKNSVTEALERLQRLVIREIRNCYPKADYYDETDLMQTLEDAYVCSNRQFVIVVDEWDAVFRIQPEDRDGQKEYLDFLRILLKDKGYVALAYMTGILPIKKYGEHSALNIFTEYSMMSPRQLAPFTGFTETEVRDLCDQYRIDYSELSKWYDGYVVSDQIPVEMREAYRRGEYAGNKISLYNPLSVVEAVTTGVIRNYWNKTETYKALEEYIKKNIAGLKDAVVLLMDGGRLRIDTSSYQNDMTTFTGRDDVLSLLVHLGYLGFDDEKSEVFIPNREILDEFRTSTKSAEWIELFKSFERSEKLLKATWAKDEITVAALVEEAHNRADNKSYNNEAALSYGIQLAYYAAQKYYTTILELDTGKGYADIVYLPAPDYSSIPALLIELKYGKSADAAMEQVKRQKYLARLEHYKGNILVICINYDKDLPSEDPEFKRHSCIIQEA